MPISGKLTGAKAWKATFAAMPQIVQDRMGDAVQLTASEMKRDAKGRVDVETGTLRDHIDFSYSPTYCRAKIGITPGTIFIGQGNKGKVKAYRASHYAHLVEFGSSRLKAHPFMTPAFTGQQGPFDARMQAAQRASIDDLANLGSSLL